MTLSWGLTRILWRQALPVTLLGSLALGLYALAWPSVLSPHDFWPGFMVALHCLLLAALLGRLESPPFAFLCSRGYSRDALWGHLMLVSALSVLAAWLPAALLVWTGLRSQIHDQVFQSPFFPFFDSCETSVPLVWLGLYLLLVPACHYAWIRRAQPTKGGHSGHLLVGGLLLAVLFLFFRVRSLDGWFAWVCGVSYLAVVVSLLVGSRTLHRSLEVRA